MCLEKKDWLKNSRSITTRVAIYSSRNGCRNLLLVLLRLFAVTNEMSEVSLYYVTVLNVLFLWYQPFEIVLHLGIAFLH